MNLATLVTPAEKAGRLFLVFVMPTFVATVYLLILVWAGAPHHVHFTQAWKTIAGLGLGESLAITVVITLTALMFVPLHSGLVRLASGYGWPTRIADWMIGRRTNALQSLESDAAPVAATGATAEQFKRQADADEKLRTSFPPRSRLRPTRFGNALTAAEHNAGRAYGLDSAVAWPRLYPLLSDPVRRVVEDRRNQMDVALSMIAACTLATVVGACLLHESGWWQLLSMAPAVLAALAHAASTVGAKEYGSALRVAFDLHRFDLYKALRLQQPADASAELRLNADLSRFWAQSDSFTRPYQQPTK